MILFVQTIPNFNHTSEEQSTNKRTGQQTTMYEVLPAHKAFERIGASQPASEAKTANE